MREITHIVLHCTATPQTAKISSIQRYWKEVLGWKSPGYHYIIQPNGAVINLLPIEEVSNGVAGHNEHSIHISYIGGVDDHDNAIDNRTKEQKVSQVTMLRVLIKKFPKAIICGHRDFPGVKKECPSFDVASWLKEIKWPVFNPNVP